MCKGPFAAVVAVVQTADIQSEFVKDGFWVDMHISKALYEREDRKLFEALVAVREVRKEIGIPTLIALKKSLLTLTLREAADSLHEDEQHAEHISSEGPCPAVRSLHSDAASLR